VKCDAAFLAHALNVTREMFRHALHITREMFRHALHSTREMFRHALHSTREMFRHALHSTREIVHKVLGSKRSPCAQQHSVNKANQSYNRIQLTIYGKAPHGLQIVPLKAQKTVFHLFFLILIHPNSNPILK
jgi:hypothetical protein